MNKLLKLGKKIKNLRSGKFSYTRYYRYLKINEKDILLESHHGEKIDGNIFYIAKELNANPAYQNYNLYLSVHKSQWNSISQRLSRYGLNRIQMVDNNSRKFYRLLASAKFLINDTSFTPYFIKKEGQIYLNTWHGTPLKTLGKKVANARHLLGNIQKNLLTSDYLLFPNSYTRNHIIDDYMLSNIYNGKIIYGGYPRNEVFFNEELTNRIRTNLSLQDKKIIAYLPTWRDAKNSEEISANAATTSQLLQQISKKLPDEYVLYINIHPMEKSLVDISHFSNILPFPSEYETYEFLAATDMLITDYSSVFFDYANTSRKVILFAYDYENYTSTRGMYTDITSLPFPIASTVDQLINHIKKPKDTTNFDDFRTKYCTYDSKTATQKLCNHVILENKELHEESLAPNGKENILIYAGNLAKNGITASLNNLLTHIDSTKYNYFVTFIGPSIRQVNMENFYPLFQKGDISYIAMTPFINGNVFTKLLLKFFERNYITAKLFLALGGKSMLHLDIKRSFNNITFRQVIMFNGYEDKNIIYFNQFKNTHSTIFVHNNMLEEIKLKKNQRFNVLRYAYKNYNTVAAVTNDLIPSINEIAEDRANIKTIENIIPNEAILKKSHLPAVFDDHTSATHSLTDVLNILKDQNAFKLISIGRFSAEKNHFTLIDAFTQSWQKNHDSYLIIIGGYGNLYSKTVDYAARKPAKDHIIIIKSLSNPYPFLAKSNAFILPSLHEGFGIVVAEANILGLPVVTTNIPGPSGFMIEHNGIMVSPSQEGVTKGVELLFSQKVPILKVDYKVYNDNAISKFSALIDS